MFVGHLALALAAKKASPRTSLAWFVAGTTMLDLVWPIFLLAGIEQVHVEPGATAFNPLVFDAYPWSHSLLMALLWGVLLAGVAQWRGVERAGVIATGLLVPSHWVLDFLSHAPDMPLWPGHSPRLGLGMWNSIPATLVIEGALWVLAIGFYLRGRTARNWAARFAFWSLVVICTGMWASGPWAAPPPSARALGWFALIGWLLLPWTAWADRGYLLAPAPTRT